MAAKREKLTPLAAELIRSENRAELISQLTSGKIIHYAGGMSLRGLIAAGAVPEDLGDRMRQTEGPGAGAGPVIGTGGLTSGGLSVSAMAEDIAGLSGSDVTVLNQQGNPFGGGSLPAKPRRRTNYNYAPGSRFVNRAESPVSKRNANRLAEAVYAERLASATGDYSCDANSDSCRSHTMAAFGCTGKPKFDENFFSKEKWWGKNRDGKNSEEGGLAIQHWFIRRLNAWIRAGQCLVISVLALVAVFTPEISVEALMERYQGRIPRAMLPSIWYDLGETSVVPNDPVRPQRKDGVYIHRDAVRDHASISKLLQRLQVLSTTTVMHKMPSGPAVSPSSLSKLKKASASTTFRSTDQVFDWGSEASFVHVKAASMNGNENQTPINSLAPGSKARIQHKFGKGMPGGARRLRVRDRLLEGFEHESGLASPNGFDYAKLAA